MRNILWNTNDLERHIPTLRAELMQFGEVEHIFKGKLRTPWHILKYIFLIKKILSDVQIAK